MLSALLSASALGVFLEGCGATNQNSGGNRTALVPQESGEARTDGNLDSNSNTNDTPLNNSVDDAPPDSSFDDSPPDNNVDDSPPDNNVDDAPADNSVDTSPPNGYVDPDSYIVDDGTTVTINFDPDGGMLLYRDVGNNEVIEFTLYTGNDVKVTIGEESVYIGSSPALRNGSYSVHVGTDGAFFGYLYIGTSFSETLTADARGTGRLVGFSGDDTLIGNFAADGINGGAGNDELFGFGGSDILRGGSDVDTLQGGIGDDELLGEGGGATSTCSTQATATTSFEEKATEWTTGCSSNLCRETLTRTRTLPSTEAFCRISRFSGGAVRRSSKSSPPTRARARACSAGSVCRRDDAMGMEGR